MSADEACLVCHRRATGHHYGAVTCEACKAFFKRTVHSCVTYFCPVLRSGSRCPVPRSGRKRHCPACRWVRCLEAKMQTTLVRCASPTIGSGGLGGDGGGGGGGSGGDGGEGNGGVVGGGPFAEETGSDLDKILDYDTEACAADAASSANSPLIPLLTPPTPQQLLPSPPAGCGVSLPLGRKPPDFMRQLAALKPTPGDPLASDRSALVNRLTELLARRDSHNEETLMSEAACVGGDGGGSGVEGQADEQMMLLSLATNRLAIDLIDFSKRLVEFGQLPMEDRVRLLQVHWLSLTVWQVAYNSMPYDGSLKFSASFAIREDQVEEQKLSAVP